MKSPLWRANANSHSQWRIQDFPQGGAPTPKSAIIFQIFAENCMKMKEFGPPGGGGGARVPGAPPLDSPMTLYKEGKLMSVSTQQINLNWPKATHPRLICSTNVKLCLFT